MFVDAVAFSLRLCRPRGRSDRQSRRDRRFGWRPAHLRSSCAGSSVSSPISRSGPARRSRRARRHRLLSPRASPVDADAAADAILDAHADAGWHSGSVADTILTPNAAPTPTPTAGWHSGSVATRSHHPHPAPTPVGTPVPSATPGPGSVLPSSMAVTGVDAAQGAGAWLATTHRQAVRDHPHAAGWVRWPAAAQPRNRAATGVGVLPVKRHAHPHAANPLAGAITSGQYKGTTTATIKLTKATLFGIPLGTAPPAKPRRRATSPHSATEHPNRRNDLPPPPTPSAPSPAGATHPAHRHRHRRQEQHPQPHAQAMTRSLSHPIAADAVVVRTPVASRRAPRWLPQRLPARARPRHSRSESPAAAPNRGRRSPASSPSPETTPTRITTTSNLPSTWPLESYDFGGRSGSTSRSAGDAPIALDAVGAGGGFLTGSASVPGVFRRPDGNTISFTVPVKFGAVQLAPEIGQQPRGATAGRWNVPVEILAGGFGDGEVTLGAPTFNLTALDAGRRPDSNLGSSEDSDGDATTFDVRARGDTSRGRSRSGTAASRRSRRCRCRRRRWSRGRAPGPESASVTDADCQSPVPTPLGDTAPWGYGLSGRPSWRDLPVVRSPFRAARS